MDLQYLDLGVSITLILEDRGKLRELLTRRVKDGAEKVGDHSYVLLVIPTPEPLRGYRIGTVTSPLTKDRHHTIASQAVS